MKGTSIDLNVVQLFRVGIHSWSIGFILTALPVYRSLWFDPTSPCLSKPGIFGAITSMFCGWAEGLELIGIVLLLIGCVHQLIRPANAIVAFVIWAIYMSLMQRA